MQHRPARFSFALRAKLGRGTDKTGNNRLRYPHSPGLGPSIPTMLRLEKYCSTPDRTACHNLMTSTCGMELRGLRLIWGTDFRRNALTARCRSTLRAIKRCCSVAFAMDALFWRTHGFGTGGHGLGFIRRRIHWHAV